MKFVASYSGGKDSALALYKALKQGGEPIALITTFTTDANRSHFHGLSAEVLDALSNALNIPIWRVETSREAYAENFEKALLKAKNLGAVACIFGDIDIEGHFEWCRARCENVDMSAVFPLSGTPRAQVVDDIIDSGFTANITIVNTLFLSQDFLGKPLTKQLAREIAATGADICGENGEYHTFVSDGPIFMRAVDFVLGVPEVLGDFAVVGVGVDV